MNPHLWCVNVYACLPPPPRSAIAWLFWTTVPPPRTAAGWVGEAAGCCPGRMGFAVRQMMELEHGSTVTVVLTYASNHSPVFQHSLLPLTIFQNTYWLLVNFWGRFSPNSSSCPGTLYMDQAGLELIDGIFRSQFFFHCEIKLKPSDLNRKCFHLHALITFFPPAPG